MPRPAAYLDHRLSVQVYGFCIATLRIPVISVMINIGYTMKPRGLRDLDSRGNLYKHPRAKRKGVYGFQGDLNPVGPEGFIV